MSKATLIFTLPEDDTEHRLALDGAKWWLVAWDMDNYLRNAIKYEAITKATTPIEAYQDARDTLAELIEGRNLSLNDYP